MYNFTPSPLSKAIKNAGERKVRLVGLDLARRKIQVSANCVPAYDQPLDETVKSRQLVEFLQQQYPLTSNYVILGMEACGGSNALTEKLTALGYECYVFPAAVCRGFNRALKDDRNDARGVFQALDTYLRNPEQATYRPCIVRDRENREKMCILNAFEAMKQEKEILNRRLVDRLCELGVSNIAYDSGVDLIARRAEEYMKAYHPQTDYLTTSLHLVLTGEIERLVDLNARMSSLEKAFFVPYAANNPICSTLMQILGVGVQTAVTVSVVTQNSMERFATADNFTAYCGLTPDHRGTGGKNRIGKNSRNGQPLLKQSLYSCAHSVISAHPEIYQPLENYKGHKRAVIKLANACARDIWKLVKFGPEHGMKMHKYSAQPAKSPDDKLANYESHINRDLRKLRKCLENRHQLLSFMLCDDPVGTVRLLNLLRAEFDLTPAELESMHTALASVDHLRSNWMKEFYNFGVAELEEFVATSLQRMVGFDERPYANPKQNSTAKHLEAATIMFDDNKCGRDRSFTHLEVDDLMFECLAAAQRNRKGEDRKWVIASECEERCSEITL